MTGGDPSLDLSLPAAPLASASSSLHPPYLTPAPGPVLFPVPFSPFLLRTTGQGCSSLHLTQGAGRAGGGEEDREASPEIQSM